jgi:uncharacterized protein with HEPN domain
MNDDRVYLRHILECISRIERHVAGGRDTFFASDTLQDATLRNLQTLSEATQRLSEAAKATQPQIPWRQIAAFRNVLVHNYLGVDLEQIWTVIHRDIPPLKQAVSAIATSGSPTTPPD